MKTQTAEGANPKTDEEYRREAERLLTETRMMSEETTRVGARSRRLGESNWRSLEHLKEMMCGNK